MKCEEYLNIIGHFKISVIHPDGTREVHFEDNLVVDGGRSLIAELLAEGTTITDGRVGSVALGVKGYNFTNILSPRVPSPTETTLVAETFRKTPALPFHTLGFDVGQNRATVLFCFVIDGPEGNIIQPSNPILGDADVDLWFPFHNDNGLPQAVAYTEAGLFTRDNRMVAIKTFPALVKDVDKRIEIDWTILI